MKIGLIQLAIFQNFFQLLIIFGTFEKFLDYLNRE